MSRVAWNGLGLGILLVAMAVIAVVRPQWMFKPEDTHRLWTFTKIAVLFTAGMAAVTWL